MRLVTHDKMWKFGKSDYGVMYAFLALAVLAALLPVVMAVRGWVLGRGVVWTSDMSQEVPAPAQFSGATIAGTVRWQLNQPNLAQALASFSPSLLLLVIVTGVAMNTWRLISRVRHGEVFSARNLGLIRSNAIMIFSYVCLGWVVNLIGDILIIWPVHRSISFFIDVRDVVIVSCGVLVMFVADIFDRGHRQSQDLEGLV